MAVMDIATGETLDGSDAFEQSLRLRLTQSRGYFRMRPERGSRLRSLAGENWDELSRSRIVREVESACAGLLALTSVDMRREVSSLPSDDMRREVSSLKVLLNGSREVEVRTDG